METRTLSFVVVACAAVVAGGSVHGTATVQGAARVRATDLMPMVRVPAGEFEMGSGEREIDAALEACNRYYGECQRPWFEVERPAHIVALDTFWIDQTEVTNGQFGRCVAASACAPPVSAGSSTRASYFGVAAFDSYPVVNVTWEHARTYCEWAGARLPTEAEWEYAARGPRGRRFPWGDEYDGTRLNSCDSQCTERWAERAFDDGHRDTAPVGSYPAGASWCGALDMAGNAWEWTADWFAPYPAERQVNPRGPASGTERAVRGEAADGTRALTRSAARHGMSPSHTYAYTGFRCAGSADRPRD